MTAQHRTHGEPLFRIAKRDALPMKTKILIRAAAILGYVGAGGLGILINEFIGWRDYESLGAVLLALFVVVFIIENTSQYLRKKLS